MRNISEAEFSVLGKSENRKGKIKMEFLSKKVMQKKSMERKVVPHPLLSEMDVSLGLKTAYAQGCVLATLMDDSKVSDEERQNVTRIGLSLGMTGEQIEECFASVNGLKSDEDKGAFIDEMKGVLAEAVVAKNFMADFETILKKNGKMPKVSVEYLDFIGLQLTGEEDWRKALKNMAKAANAKKPAEKNAVDNGSDEPKSRKGKQTAATKRPAEDDDEETPAYGFGDKVWRTNPEHNGIECSFEGKPSESVRNKLKSAGFRFSGKQGLWYAKDNDKSRKAVSALGLTCIDEDAGDEVEAEAQEDEPIGVAELIELIESTSIDVEIEDDDECKPSVKRAEVSTGWTSDKCELKIFWGYPEDGVAGRAVFEVEGVRFSADRNFDGTHEPFEISGREIDYGDDDLDEDALRDVVEDNVSVPEFDSKDCEFQENEVDASVVIDALEDEPDVFAVDDIDDVYGYSDDDDVDEDQKVIDREEAIEIMLKDGSQVDFEQE